MEKCIRWQSELIGAVFRVCFVKEEKLWEVIVVMGKHRGMAGIVFGDVVVECLGSFGERHLLSFEV